MLWLKGGSENFPKILQKIIYTYINITAAFWMKNGKFPAPKISVKSGNFKLTDYISYLNG